MTDGSPSGGLRLSSANGSAEIVDEVNLWAKNQTSGIIKNILTTDAVDSSTKLIFANAVYFKGVWKEKFNPLNTKYLDFNLLDGSKVKVPFMTSNEEQLVREYDGFKVLGLPYSQGEDRRRFTMYLYLPNEKYGMQYLIEKMGSESNFLDNYMPHYKREVAQLLIPRFKIPFKFVASDMLKKLGLVLPFTGGEGLTEMVDPSVREKLYVSGIYHKSFVEVNEEGTEAAAVTVNVMIPQCLMRVVRVEFIADHPFLFVIKEDTNAPVGISDPDLLSFADAPSRHPIDVAQSSLAAFEIRAGGKADEEDERVEQRCAEIDARLDALFDEELYPHTLTAIAGRRWVIGRGLRLAVMKYGESLELRQAFADAVSLRLRLR
nr:serpin-ZX-like [Tanacetum cinerariifolium]